MIGDFVSLSVASGQPSCRAALLLPKYDNNIIVDAPLSQNPDYACGGRNLSFSNWTFCRQAQPVGYGVQDQDN